MWNSTGTPCADPMNSKSMSFTGRADGSAGILRQHDVLGEQHIDAFLFMYHVRIIIVYTINYFHYVNYITYDSHNGDNWYNSK